MFIFCYEFFFFKHGSSPTPLRFSACIPRAKLYLAKLAISTNSTQNNGSVDRLVILKLSQVSRFSHATFRQMKENPTYVGYESILRTSNMEIFPFLQENIHCNLCLFKFLSSLKHLWQVSRFPHAMFRHVEENPAYIKTEFSAHPTRKFFPVFRRTSTASVSF